MKGLANSVRAYRLGILAVVLMLGVTITARAQYSIDWYRISGGGGTSTGSVYAVSGTIGQSDASGTTTSGSYSLIGGFWAFISLVQTPGAPKLCISRSGSSAIIYWQAVSGWTLQQNNSLTVPAGWAGSSGVTTSNGTNYLFITAPSGNLFFRLNNP